jgi:(R,R)-butanediol dehydrogenase/meso-butanediol dehydrogenase/diacetyl reductase
MKALVFRGPGQIIPEQVLEPRPAAGELLIRPSHVGICFTDKHVYEGSGGYDLDLVLGHEASGRVVEAGEGVEGWSPGDRVALSPQVYCGQCEMCRSGWYIHCQQLRAWVGCYGRRPGGEPYHGMAAEYCAVPAYTCFPVPDTVSDIASTNVEATACGTRAVRLSGMTAGDNVVILGAEDYNLSVLQWARNSGARQTLVVDPIELRRELAAKLGADAVLDPRAATTPDEIREQMPFGADCVFVAMEDYVAPSLRYLSLAFDIARVQGTVGILRAYGEQAFHGLDPVVPWTKEITIRHFGVCFGEEPWRGGRQRGDFELSIEAIAAGRIDAESHVTRIVPFDEVNTRDDVDDLYRSLPEREAKILLRISD